MPRTHGLQWPVQVPCCLRLEQAAPRTPGCDSQPQFCLFFPVTALCPLGALWNLALILSIWSTVTVSA